MMSPVTELSETGENWELQIELNENTSISEPFKHINNTRLPSNLRPIANAFI